MKARDKARLATLRLVTAALKQREIDERIELNDGQVTEILIKLDKQRQDSIEQYEKAGRADLVAQESAERAIIAEYLPTALSADEIAALIRAAITETGATSMRDMGKVMAWLRPKMQGRADLGAVSKDVKSTLA